MRRVTLSQLAPVAVHDQLLQDGIEGAMLLLDGSLRVFGPACDVETEAAAVTAWPGADAIWSRSFQFAPGKGKTATAINLLQADPRLTPAAAAKQAGVNVAAVYRQLGKQSERGTCPHCHQLLPKKQVDLHDLLS